MSIQDLGSLGELIAAIATVVTLVYLAAQIRANTRALRVESRRFETQGSNPFMTSIIDSPEVAKMFMAGLADPDSLSPEDFLRFSLLLGQHIGASAGHYDEVILGSAPKRDLERRKGTDRIFLDTPGGRRFWQRFSDQYPDHYREYVERELLTDKEPTASAS